MNFLSLLSPTSIMAAVIIALSLSNILFYNLYSGAKDDYATVQATLTAERNQAKADAEAARAVSERITQDVSDSWSRALDHLRNHPVRVLPARGCVSNSNAGTTYGLNAAAQATPTDTRTITAEECEAYLTDAIEDSTRLVWLQYWIREQQ